MLKDVPCIYLTQHVTPAPNPDANANEDRNQEESSHKVSDGVPNEVKARQPIVTAKESAVNRSSTYKENKDVGRMPPLRTSWRLEKALRGESSKPQSAKDRKSQVDEILGQSPPPDEPELLSQETRKSGLHWANLIGGTTRQEKAAIRKETLGRRIAAPSQGTRQKLPNTTFISQSQANLDEETRAKFAQLQEEQFYLRPSVRIAIPDQLKAYLVDDWENVTKSLLLVPLPSRAPVNFILDTYFEEEKGLRRLGSAEADILEEFVAGMKTYFEKAIGKTLLYRYERAQYAEVRSIPRSNLVQL